MSDIESLTKSLVQLDTEVRDYEMRLKGLKADRDGTLRELIRLKGTKKIIEVP